METMTAREQYAEVLAAVLAEHPPKSLMHPRNGDACVCGWTGHPHWAHVAACTIDALATALPDPEQAVREALERLADELEAEALAVRGTDFAEQKERHGLHAAARRLREARP